MCWKGYNVKHIAEKDIKVFKICKSMGDRSCISSFMGFIYEIEETYKSDLNVYIHDNNITYIFEGLHSYSLDLLKILDKGYSGCFDYVEISYKGEFIERYEAKSCYVECIIPKGSTYYLNYKGEYVSDTIKILNIKPIEEVCAGFQKV